MKIKLSQLRRLIREAYEEKCPQCGSVMSGGPNDCWIGGTGDVHCTKTIILRIDTDNEGPLVWLTPISKPSQPVNRSGGFVRLWDLGKDYYINHDNPPDAQELRDSDSVWQYFVDVKGMDEEDAFEEAHEVETEALREFFNARGVTHVWDPELCKDEEPMPVDEYLSPVG